MVLVRRIRSRGANIVVEANGEVLFAPTGDVGRWTNRFSHRVIAGAEQAAPVNKRPRWGHYGKPLKATIKGSTTYHPSRMKVYSAVGSTAPHGYYVDQGTGVYAGNGPYEAKVLPPWQRGSASLYEATWRPTGPGGRKVAKVMIRGQKGQFFLDAGVKRGFQSMRMRSVQLPGEGASRMSAALSSFPEGLANFLGNTVADAAFRLSLAEWRAWRDEAWDAGEGLGRGGGVGSRSHSEFMTKARVEAHRKATAKAKSLAKKPTKKATAVKKPTAKKPTRPKQGYATLRDKQNAAVAAFAKQNPGVEIVGRITTGLVVVAPRDKRRYTIPWSRLYTLIP